MPPNFASALNGIFSATNSSSDTECDPTINHYTFYQYSLIPAALITLAFAVTRKRTNKWLNVLSGRPGLIFPMDSLTRSSTISYACAFGSTAYLVYLIVLYQTYAIEYDGNRAVKSFIAIASMFVYGMVFFPLFSSLAIGSVFSYGLGTLYVWMVSIVQIFRLVELECNVTAHTRVLLVFRGLPGLLCLMYLSISMPIRVVKAFKKGRYFYWDDDFHETNTMEDIQASYSGLHVKKLFEKPILEQPRLETKTKIVGLSKDLFKRFVYRREKGFRYSSRILSVMLVSLIVVYTLTFELLALLPALLDDMRDGVLSYMDSTVGRNEAANETESDTHFRNALWIVWDLLGITRICLIVSVVLATVFAVFNILHSLSSYRANLFALYRGDHSHIPPASANSNTSQCVNSIKFAGYQVGYIIWSYLLQFAILTLIAFVCALIILLIKYEFNDWLVWLIELLWPIVLTAALVAIIQILLSKFVFLQDNGQYLALNNRRLYFNFTYFMFFYNIFLGLVSCLLRILKAMFVGIVFLSRLDNSTLPRRFEFIDPGFQAYVGYMHIEAVHTNPVAVVFTRLMLLGLQKKRERLQTAGSQALNRTQQMEMVKREKTIQREGDVKLGMKGSDKDVYLSEQQYRRSVAARFNWHVMYTLLHNPDIRVTRKGYVQMLRQARLLGVHIPVSDRQADVNVELLRQNIADAKERLKPVPKKKGNDAYLVKGDDDLDEVVAVKGGGNASKPGGATSKNNKTSNVDGRETKRKGGHSLGVGYTDQREGSEDSRLGHNKGQRAGTPKNITSVDM